MFVRCKKRFKDGKEHRYWSVEENCRVRGGRVDQRQVLYLGEINDSGSVEKICRSCRLCDLAPPFLKIPAGLRFVQVPLHAGTSTRSSSLARSRRPVRQSGKDAEIGYGHYGCVSEGVHPDHFAFVHALDARQFDIFGIKNLQHCRASQACQGCDLKPGHPDRRKDLVCQPALARGGNQPKVTAIVHISTMPSQNAGRDCPRSAMVPDIRSNTDLLQTALMTSIGMAVTTLIRTATIHLAGVLPAGAQAQLRRQYCPSIWLSRRSHRQRHSEGMSGIAHDQVGPDRDAPSAMQSAAVSRHLVGESRSGCRSGDLS